MSVAIPSLTSNPLDKTIAQLPAAGSLAGGDYLPISQSAATKRTTLTAVVAAAVAAVPTPTISSIGLGQVNPQGGAYTLVDTDNGSTIVCSSSPVLTIDNGLVGGFGCTIVNAFAYGGSAAVTDQRQTTGIAACTLLQIGADVYWLIGSK